MVVVEFGLCCIASHRGASVQCAPSPGLMLAGRKAWAPNRQSGMGNPPQVLGVR